MESLKIPFCYAVELFDGYTFDGASRVLNGLFWTDQTMADSIFKLFDEDIDFENRTSSVQVWKTC